MILNTMGIIQERINVELQKALKGLGLNIHCGHIWLLLTVYENDGEIEIKELVRILEKKKTTISDIITTLEKNGYLTKRQSLSDRRIYKVYVTSKAKEEKDIILKIVQDIQDKMFKNISENNMKVTDEVLVKISTNLQE